MKPEQTAALQKFTASHNGKPLNQKALLKPSVMVAKILVARFMSMTPQQQQSVKGLVTPGNSEALKILLPELATMNKGADNAAG